MSQTSIATPPATLTDWAQRAKARLAEGTLTPSDIDEALQLASKHRPAPAALRQRLLYLHATTPSIGSHLVGAALHEPRKGGVAQMDPMQKDPTYKSVHEAILDGWHIIHFPQQIAPFDDKEIDVLGYEFILQKLEAVHE